MWYKTIRDRHNYYTVQKMIHKNDTQPKVIHDTRGFVWGGGGGKK